MISVILLSMLMILFSILSVILQLVSDLESDLRKIVDLGLDADNDFPWQVHTPFQQGCVEEMGAKHFRLIRGELKVFFMFFLEQGGGGVGVETIFYGNCTSLRAMFLLTYDLNSFKSKIN